MARRTLAVAASRSERCTVASSRAATVSLLGISFGNADAGISRMQRSMDFKSLIAILWGRRAVILSVTVLTVGIAVYVTLQMSPKYSATTTLIIDFDEPAVSSLTSPLAPSLQTNYMSTQLGIIGSKHVAGKVVDDLKLAETQGWRDAFQSATGGKGDLRDWIAGALLSSVEVTPGSNSRLVNIRYTSGDPEVAALIANAFAEAYRRTNLEMNTAPAQREAEQYRQWLQELRDKVAVAQQNLSAFQQKNGVLVIDERLDIETARLKELVEQKVQTETEARAAEGRLRRIETLKTEGGSLETLNEVQSNDVIRDLKSHLGVKEAEYAEISRQLGSNHPRRERAAAEIATLRARLNSEVSSIAESVRSEAELARSRLEAFQASEDAQKARILEIKQKLDEMPALVRELNGAQVNYEEGLAKKNQFELQSRAVQTNVTVLNPALAPLQSSSPKVSRNILLAAILGFLVSLGTVFLLEMLDRRVRTEDELHDLDVSYLGRLPLAK